MTRLRIALFCVGALLLGACAGPRPVLERGWVGGEMRPVRSDGGWLLPDGPALFTEFLIGMPDDVEADAGLLVVRAHPDTPLALAGIVPGDLLLRANGKELSTAEDLARAAEEVVPGETMQIDVRRRAGGPVEHVMLAVGRESYRDQGTLSIGLVLSGRLDLWPFDDGIDVFGLITIATYDQRYQLASVEGDYLGGLDPEVEVSMPPQERFVFRVIPIGVGSQKVLVSQEAVD
jgi:membrane-associated protease RseP (regulator of RpoE activity)